MRESVEQRHGRVLRLARVRASVRVGELASVPRGVSVETTTGAALTVDFGGLTRAPQRVRVRLGSEGTAPCAGRR
ncbi:hypothetical protein ACFWPY_12795 [Streptomyces sp. NPDC058527]|uniref:hypothetical protein n=1 Tax=unclassified Streptomyces TaxID=2593676 RepID=UPI003646485C